MTVNRPARKRGKYGVADIAALVGMTEGSTRVVMSREGVKVEDFAAVIDFINRRRVAEQPEQGVG